MNYTKNLIALLFLYARRLPVLFLLFPVIIGIIVYDRLDYLPVFCHAVWLIGGVFFILVLLIWLYWQKGSHLSYTFTFLALSFVSGILLGMIACFWQDERLNIDFDRQLQKEPDHFTIAVVENVVKRNRPTVRYGVRIIGNGDTTKWLPAKALALVYCSGYTQTLSTGDTIIVPMNWEKISENTCSLSFDFARYCKRRQIYFRQFVDTNSLCLLSSNIHPGFFTRIHRHGLSKIEREISDPRSRALLKAMLLGDEEEIDPQIREQYRDTGIIHIVSISGAHIAVLFLGITALLRWLPFRFSVLKYPVAIVMIWCYVCITGLSAPSVRAALFFSIGIIGLLGKQQRNSIQQLMLAGTIMLLVYPAWLFQPGFQLSFTAVFSILVFYPFIYRLCARQNKWWNYCWSMISVSLAAEILVAPLVLYYFHQFPLWFLIANIVASIGMGALLYLGCVLLLVGNVTLLIKPITLLIEWISDVFHFIINFLQTVSPAGLKSIYLSATSLFLLYIFIGCLYLFFRTADKKLLITGLASMWMLALHLCITSYIRCHQHYLFVERNSNCTQIISANRYYSLFPVNYSETHIFLQSFRWQKRKANDVYFISGKRILVLDSVLIPRQQFKIDILVVNTAFPSDSVPVLYDRFRPDQVILNKTVPFKESLRWISVAEEKNINIHTVRRQGDLIFPFPS